MSISQRKDGRWLVKYKDRISGTWKQKAFRNEEEARQFDADNQYDKIENTQLTLRECVTLFLQNTVHCQKNLERYSFLVNGYDTKKGTHTEGPAEFLANKYCSELTRRDLENFRQNCRARDMKITTLNGHVSRIKAALNWAVQEELLSENPWAKFKNLPGGKVQHLEGSMEDFQKLYAALPEWAQWACRTCLALCLRPGESELCALKWESFNWQGKFVSVYMPKVASTKTVFPPETYLAEAWERYQEDKSKGFEYVCKSIKGRQMSYPTFIKTWSKTKKRLGTTICPYAMRHIAASMMLYAGADLASVAAQLGHKNISTTASFYTHAIAEGQRRAAIHNPMVQLGAGEKGDML